MVHASQQVPSATDEAGKTKTEPPRRGPANWAFRTVAVITSLFILTILIMTAVMLADPRVPVNKSMSEWFDRYALGILTLEISLIGLFVVIAFRIDRRESLKKYAADLEAYEARMKAKLAATPNTATNSGEQQ